MKHTGKITPVPKSNYIMACRRYASKPDIHIFISLFISSSRLLSYQIQYVWMISWHWRIVERDCSRKATGVKEQSFQSAFAGTHKESTVTCLQNSLSSTFLRVCVKKTVKERHMSASCIQWLASKYIMLNGPSPKQNATLLQFLHHTKAHTLPLSANGKILRTLFFNKSQGTAASISNLLFQFSKFLALVGWLPFWSNPIKITLDNTRTLWQELCWSLTPNRPSRKMVGKPYMNKKHKCGGAPSCMKCSSS